MPWDWTVSTPVGGDEYEVYFEEDIEHQLELLMEWICEYEETSNGKPWEFTVMRDNVDVTADFNNILD